MQAKVGALDRTSIDIKLTFACPENLNLFKRANMTFQRLGLLSKINNRMVYVQLGTSFCFKKIVR